MKALVVGATGQLGTATVRRLLDDGAALRALVRTSSSYDHLAVDGVELVFGDLRDRHSVSEACDGVDCVISTATVVFPRGRYSFDEDEGAGYANLLDASAERGVDQFVFISNLAPYISPYVDEIPTLRFKLEIEDALKRSGLAYTIFRSAPFMDDWFALIGSDIPLRGAEAASLRRPFWFTRMSMGGSAGMIERFGVAAIPGPARARHAFVAIDDVARYLARAAGERSARRRTFEIGGPENLSWQEVVDLYGRLLGRPVRALPSVPSSYRLGANLIRRLSPAAANQMGLMWMLGENETIVDSDEVARMFDVEQTSAEAFLSARVGSEAGARVGSAS